MTSTAASILLAVSVVTATSLVAVHAPAGDETSLPAVITLTGEIATADRGRVLERTFVVPPGTRQIDIDFGDDLSEATLALDFGVRGPAGWRGWSEARSDRIHIDSTSASYGYLPGPIEPGLWSVLIGVASVSDATIRYRTSVRLSDTLDRPRAVLQSRAGWYAGDLHTHSGHSDGYHVTADGSRIAVPVGDIAASAARQGLDFVAVTDHNTTSHWIDLDRAQAAESSVLLMHGSEVTTYEGHFNAIGARRLSEFRLDFARPMRVLLDETGSDGAFLSINHPLASDDEWCPGCGWTHLDRQTLGAVRGIEVVNGPTRDALPTAWRLWADLLNAGHRLVAVGGSDTHDVEGSDRRLGQPATVVYATALSEDAIGSGLRSGRVYIRTARVDGPSIELRGTVGSRTAVMGGTLPPGPVTLIAHLEGAIGQECVWLKRGREVQATRVDSDVVEVVLESDAIAGDWFSLVVRSPLGPTAITNAIYVAR